MPNIQPLDINLEGPRPLYTIFYRDVQRPNRFEDLQDPILDNYLAFLTRYFRNHEIVGSTEADFFANLELAWHFQRAKFVKYGLIYEGVRPRWGEHITTSSGTTNDGDSNSSGKNSDIAISTASDPVNDVPTSTNYSENKYKNHIQTNTHMTTNNGDVGELNEYLKKQKTLEAYLVDIFDGCFVKGNIYGY